MEKTYHMIIEQTSDYKYRIEYDAKTNTFYETEYKSLFFSRDCPYPYGWIKETGTPPGRHLDVILISNGKYALGEEINIKIIGCFVRNDGDSKLIAIPLGRKENDYTELTNEEKSTLNRLYPNISGGEGWYGLSKAMEVIREGNYVAD